MSAENKEDSDEKSFLNADKKKISCKYWMPKRLQSDEKPRALVFICHGLGEHVRSYDSHATALANEGYFVFGHDHVGHGLSEGDRVHVNSFTEYTRDVIQHIDMVQLEHKDLPLFIIGHSMGGTIALKVGLEKPNLFHGMILLGPAIKPNPQTATTFKIMAAKVISRIIPQVGIGTLEAKEMCRDPAVVEKYEKDPLVWHGKVKAKQAVELLMAMNDVMKRINEVTWPLLTICGTDDKLIEPEGCTLLHEKASSSDKTLKMIKGGLHQIHNEPEGVGTQCMEDIMKWIKDHC